MRSRPSDPAQGLLAFGPFVFPCALGSGGVRALKREGDGATPLARMRPLGLFHRADRRPAGVARTQLEVARIRPDLGWCDAPDDPRYNRPVRLPHPAGHERMLREDALYDVCVVLDWNIVPRRRGRGSAIFLHIARPGMQPTEGCIAVSPRVMARLLPFLSPATRLRVLR